MGTDKVMAMAMSDETALGLAALFTGFGLVCTLISLAATIIVLVAEWKMFSKAGEAGWKVLIPIYNTYITFKIIYGNGWKFLFLIVPVLDIIFSIAMYIRLAQVFGKGTGFGILSIFFSPITTCILGFGSAQYQGAVTDKFF